MKNRKFSKNMRSMKLYLYFVILLTLMSLFSIKIQAQSERIVRLCNELNKLKMYDYSEYQLKKSIAANPKDVDMLKVALAETYMEENKAREGEKIIRQITKNSPFYSYAQYVIGLAATRKGKYKLAIKAFKNYFSCFSPSDPPKSSSEEARFRTSVVYLQFCYKQLGDAKNAAKVVKFLEWLATGNKSENKREVTFYALKAKLDAAEKQKKEEEADPKLHAEAVKRRKEERKAMAAYKKALAAAKKSKKKIKIKPPKIKKDDWILIVNSTLKEFEELKWLQDMIGAFAYVQRARALCLLGRYKDALEEIKKNPVLLKACDDAMRKENQIGQSPGAGARFWAGEAFLGLAKRSREKKEKLSYLTKAMHQFCKILKDYPGYPRMDDAFSELMSCKDLLEKQLGRTVRLPKYVREYKPKRGVKLLTGIEDRLFKEKKYKELIERLLNIIHKKRNVKGIDAVFQRLIYSYAQLHQDLEAMAIADYMANFLPPTEVSSVGLLQAGQVFWDIKKREVAVRIYQDYLKSNPSHQYAAAIAMRVAKYYYDKAKMLAQKANKLPQGDKKKEIAEAAILAYKDAIPHYQLIVDNYRNTKFGHLSFYLLALCYSSSKQFVKAAEIYLQYCNYEKKDKVKIADAKLRVADNFFQAGQFAQKQADKLRNEAYKMAVITSPAFSSDSKENNKNKSSNLKKTGKNVEETTKSSEKSRVKAKSNKDKAVNGQLAEAENLEKQAKKFFKTAIIHLTELINSWLKPGGRVGPVSAFKKAKDRASLLKTEENAYELLAWAYDASEQKQEAIKAFTKFLKKFPKSKRIPTCMMRLGVIYTELNNDAMAEKILGSLVKKYPDSKEGKNAPFLLARSLFKNKKYAKSIALFNDILKKKSKDICTVPNLRWILSNLIECSDPKYKKQCAKISLKAASMLLKLIEKPNLADWVGKEGAFQIAKDPKKVKDTIKILKQKLLFDAGNAAFWAEKYKVAVEKLSLLLEDDMTPYLYKAKFLRANAYQKLKDYDKARRDLGDVSLRAMAAKDDAKYSRAQCLIGDTFIEEGNYKKALGTFNLMAVVELDSKVNSALQIAGLSPEQRAKRERNKKEEREWIEYAIYKAALCNSKLGNKKDAQKMIQKYLKYFPQGKFIEEIKKLQ